MSNTKITHASDSDFSVEEAAPGMNTTHITKSKKATASISVKIPEGAKVCTDRGARDERTNAKSRCVRSRIRQNGRDRKLRTDSDEETEAGDERSLDGEETLDEQYLEEEYFNWSDGLGSDHEYAPSEAYGSDEGDLSTQEDRYSKDQASSDEKES
ncbi:Uu.00g045990.m01.CDS01 [Anthostomella pinea]|uniref:Uu.00g045990.m01.CDS01 n=1 Tax=Anthostomella pinea TaxID=933095 RepID=A0AAI8VC96_9PEZI|nr:Uu.00g045990.m01.CDS01 [Anthostomella pinea]